jgi:hypothetical protein
VIFVAGQNEEIVRKSVEKDPRRFRDLFGFCSPDDLPLSSAADGAGDMEVSGGRSSSGQDEGAQGGKSAVMASISLSRN